MNNKIIIKYSIQCDTGPPNLLNSLDSSFWNLSTDPIKYPEQEAS